MPSISISNFTVTIVSFPAVTGEDFTQDNPSVVLFLTPDAGYTINANNFSAASPLPSYVSSVVFSQNGANINCVVNYISPSLMPASDVLIDICASGYAEQTPVTVSGTVKDCGISNVVQPPSGVIPYTYNGSGEFETTATVVTQTVVASTGYYFDVTPVLALSIGNISNYTITNVKTYNSSSQLIQIVFTVTYTFPVENISGNELCLTANAIPTYVPSVRIQSYNFTTSSVAVSGAIRNFTIKGITGANWALTCVANVGGANIVNTSGVIDSTGTAAVNVIFPLTTVDQSYTFTLTGDLAASFDTATGQPSVITVYQYVDTSLSFGFTSSNADITVGAPVSRSFIPYGPTPLTYTYDVTATSVSDIILLSPLPLAGWTNQNLLSPSYAQNVVSNVVTIDNTQATKTITAQLGVAIDFAGTSDLLSILDLDNYVQGALVPLSLTFGATATAACCAGISGSYFVGSGQTFLTATSILDASGNAAADGFYKQ